MEVRFKVEGGVVSGLRYISVVKRAGLTVDKVRSFAYHDGRS